VAGSPYNITPSAATGGTFTPGNYVISYVDGKLTIAPAPLSITATDVSKTYGTVPTLSGFTPVGLVNAETIGSVTETSPGSPATAPVAGSPYNITPSAASGGTFTPGNYVISYVDGKLTVEPAPLPWPVIDTPPSPPPGVVPVIPWVVTPPVMPPELETLNPPVVVPAPPAAPVVPVNVPEPVVVLPPPPPPAPVLVPRPIKQDRN
jgi:hypothetical protein